MKIFHLVLAAVVLPSITVQAMFIRPEAVPVQRLVDMANAAIAKEPGSAEAHYTLARIYFLASASGTESLFTYPNGGKVPIVAPRTNLTTAGKGQFHTEAQKRLLAVLKVKEIPAGDTELGKRYRAEIGPMEDALREGGWTPAESFTEEQASARLTKAAEEFQIARKLEPRNALYQLGYASFLELAVTWGKQRPAGKLPVEIRALKPADIRSVYREAWQLELQADLADKKKRGMFSPMNMVSYEAGSAYIRLAESAKEPLTTAETMIVDEVRKSLKKLEHGLPMAITPIVFSLVLVDSFEELLEPDNAVTFPLRGWGTAGCWPWVKPETALLVWNPSGNGKVQSGAQLFGSYTWELFWNNGYEPLAVLDADGDGFLTGGELRGLAAWFDRNGNGISDPGEVQPLSELGVTALAVKATGSADENVPMNPQGITFSDGRVLPTWDWIATEK